MAGKGQGTRIYHVVVSVRAPSKAVAGRSIERRLKGAPARREAAVIRVQDEDGRVLWRPSQEADR